MTILIEGATLGQRRDCVDKQRLRDRGIKTPVFIKEWVIEEAMLLWASSKWKLVTWVLTIPRRQSKVNDPAAAQSYNGKTTSNTGLVSCISIHEAVQQAQHRNLWWCTS